MSAVPADDAVLEVEDLRSYFRLGDGLVRAVDGVSLSLGRGRTLGIVGESGSGKSVLGRTIMGLNRGRDVIVQGSVRIRGRSVLDQHERDLMSMWGTEVATVFQDPMTSLNPVLKVGRQVTEHVERHLDVPRRRARELGIELLRRVRIPEPEQRFDQYPHQLSGGMRQRVCIAMAVACEPALLIADEPTTALDVTVQHEVLNLLAREQRERAMSMILITHDLGVAAGRTDEVAVMYAGRIVEQAPTEVLFSDMKMPYTEALFRSIPRFEQPKHARLPSIVGRPPDPLDLPPGCPFSARCPYTQARCLEEAPPLTVGEDSRHSYRCWYPVRTPEGQEAWDRNLGEGRAQTLEVAAGLDHVREAG